MTDFAHMCRDGHEEIGHNDNQGEMCPVCRALAKERHTFEVLEQRIRDEFEITDRLRSENARLKQAIGQVLKVTASVASLQELGELVKGWVPK